MTNAAHRTEISWSLQSGAEAKVVVEMVRRIRHLGTDDHMGEVTKDLGWVIRTTATAAGVNHNGLGYISESDNPDIVARGYTHQIGQLAIPAAKASEIIAAVAAHKATPEWQEQMADEARSEQDAAAYAAHVRMINRAL